MGLRSFIDDLNGSKDWYATSNVGFFNVESGWAAFRSKWVSQCECASEVSDSIQYDCTVCSRTRSDSLTIPSGDGDGLYTVVSFLNNEGQIFASATLFDPSSELASEFINEIEYERIRDFNSLPIIFKDDLPGIKLGNLEPSDGTLFYSDNEAGIDSAYATVTVKNWIPGRVSVYAFMEDSLESEASKNAVLLGGTIEDFNGGLEGSVRPRVILLLSDARQQLSHGLVSRTNLVPDWPSQISAWRRQLVFSHMNERGAEAIFWNGRLVNNYGSFASENDLDTGPYVIGEFSWYLQGATFGVPKCSEYVDAMIEETGGELEETDILQYAYLERGMLTKARSLGPISGLD
jgi:hypothetical protein